MNTSMALQFFVKQVERSIISDTFDTQVITLPSSFSPKGIVIKIAVLKTYIQKQPLTPNNNFRTMRVRITVSGTAESETGLFMALDAIEKLDNFLSNKGNDIRLENLLAEKLPNTRITQSISEEDSFLDSPDSTSVQDVEDSRIVTITFPQGVINEVQNRV